MQRPIIEEIKILFAGKILRTANITNKNKQTALVQQTKEGLYLKLIKQTKEDVISSVIDMMALRMCILLFY
jgi:hypothetical protein